MNSESYDLFLNYKFLFQIEFLKVSEMLTSFFRKAKKSGSNIFAMFSQRQIQEFKEAFGIMDCDKNGLLSADDLVSAFAAVGKSISGGEADNMLSESPGPVNFTQMVTLFAEKMAGGKTFLKTLPSS